MSVRAQKVEIHNYRCIHELEMVLPGHGVIYGDYQVGKTSIFQAICLALGAIGHQEALNKDSFHHGLLDYDNITQHEQLSVQVTLMASQEGGLNFLREVDAQAMGYWNEETESISYKEKPKGACEAVKVVFVASVADGVEVRFRRYLARPETTISLSGTEPDLTTDIASELGIFFFPMQRDSNKWARIHVAELQKALNSWVGKAPDYLSSIDEAHKQMSQFMDQVNEQKKDLTEQKQHKLQMDIAQFVHQQAQLLMGAAPKFEIDKVSDQREILKSFDEVIEEASMTDLLYLMQAGMRESPSFAYYALAFEELMHRVQEGKPVMLFLDEPEIYFEGKFFWSRFLELAKQSNIVQLVLTTHSIKLLEFFPEEHRSYVHNVFGTLSLLDEVVFKGLYC